MGHYDVFLSYARADERAVDLIARRLRAEGLKVFLDKWNLIPGEPWQEALEKALDRSRSCAAFLGKEIGAWQNEEIRSALETRVYDASFRVVPVLLPDGRPLDRASIPRFLRRLTLVDFSNGLDDENAFRQLLLGIKGEAPEPGLSEGSESWSALSVPREAESNGIKGAAPLLPLATSHWLITAEAKRELYRIRQMRLSSPEETRRQTRKLVDRIQTGDLQHADLSIKAQVLEFAARLHAGTKDTLEAAKSLRDQLLEITPTASTVIIDALTQTAEGNLDASLRMLRDSDEPEARGLLFSLLAKHRGNDTALEWFQSQDGRSDPHFFGGLGWYNLSVSLAQAGHWEEACNYLSKTSEYQTDTPDLLYLEGVVNAAMVLPLELRDLVLEPGLPPASVIEGTSVEQYRSRAVTCFRQAQETFTPFSQAQANAAKRWIFWLLLTNPQEKENATTELSKQLENTAQGVAILPVACLFGVPFDTDKYWKHLELRDKQGGLDKEELHARFLLAELRLTPVDFYLFLEGEEARLGHLLAPNSLASKKMSTLLGGGQTTTARRYFEEHKDLFDDEAQRIILLNLDAKEGIDARQTLEEIFQKSPSFLNLINLINYLWDVRDWKALSPLLKDLFHREANRSNLLRLAECMERDLEANSEELLGLLNANMGLVELDSNLLAAKARTLLRLGSVVEASALSDRLLQEQEKEQKGVNPSNIDFSIDLALQSGDWDRFHSIIDRAWPRREQLPFDALLRLAALASETDATPDRAVELLKLSVQKANDNPHVLMAAVLLMYRLGKEGREVTEWTSKALSLSSEEGPVTQVELRKVAEEILPRHREESRKAEELWHKGEIPVHFVSERLNIPLSILLLDLPYRSLNLQDSRRRAIIPIASGARQPVEIEPGWRVGFDITSLMVLYSLGVLREALTSVHQAVIAPDTMLVLLNERNQIRFHQPSLVRAAEEIRHLIDIECLRVAEHLPPPPSDLAGEVGHDLAQLLETARREGACVVRPRPVHRLPSFGTELAQLGEYDALVASTLQFENLLHARGYVGRELHEGASMYLRTFDMGNDPGGPLSLDRPVYLDDLALTYLQGAGLLPALKDLRLDLRIHPSVRDEQFALISNARQRERLAQDIDALRNILRETIQAGRLRFLRRHVPTEEESRVFGMAPTLGQLMRDTEDCDAVSMDDRGLQRFEKMADRSGHTVPVISALDILQHLEKQGALSSAQRHVKLHRLRQGGFAFIPVELEELVHYLPSQIREGALVESSELRIIRQTLARIRSLDIFNPAEAAFLGRLQLVSVMAIRQFWSDENIDVEHAILLSDWIWHHVAPSPVEWLKVSSENRQGILDALVYHLGLLLAPQAAEEERLVKFAEWVQDNVLASLLPVNAAIVEQLSTYMAQQIETWSNDIDSGNDEESQD